MAGTTAWQKSQHQSHFAHNAQALSALTGTPPQAVSELSAGRSQISKSVAACVCPTIPQSFWATDITYIPAAKRMVYLCAVLDLCGKMVLAYRIGGDMTSSLVTDNTPPPPVRLRPGTKIFSDTGALFSVSQKIFHCRIVIRASGAGHRRLNVGFLA